MFLLPSKLVRQRGFTFTPVMYSLLLRLMTMILIISAMLEFMRSQETKFFKQLGEHVCFLMSYAGV